MAAVANPAQLEQFRIKYLGAKGSIKGLMKLLGQMPKDQKPAVGQQINAVAGPSHRRFRGPQNAFIRRQRAPSHAVDVTEPGKRPRIGNRHILMKVIDELTELFGRMGFSARHRPGSGR